MRRYFLIVAIVSIALVEAGCATTSSDGHGATVAMVDTADPLDSDGTIRLARASLKGGDVDSGIKLLKKAVATDPQSTDAKEALATALFDAGALKEASVAFEDLRAAERGTFKGELGLGRVALASGDADLARTRFQEILSHQPDNAQALNGMAISHDYMNQHAEAQRIYRRLLAATPADHAIANNLAVSRTLSGDVDAAIDELTELASGPAILPQARYNLALAYGLKGDMDAAQEILRPELSRDETTENLAFYKAAAERSGQRKQP